MKIKNWNDLGSSHQITCLIPITVIILAQLFCFTQIADAQQGQTCDRLNKIIDLNSDGKPEGMVLDCRFTPTSHDQLTIIKNVGRLTTDIPWKENINYENEVWIFDHNSDGRANLIISFHKEGNSLVADLYDDRDKDGEVSYQNKNGKVIITENKYWTVRVIAEDGWWRQGALLNYNLHLLIDGDVEGIYISENYRSELVTDGNADFEIFVLDLDHDGKPDYDMRKQNIPWLQGAVAQGTQMMVNWYDNEAPISGGFDLWPYLNLNHIYTNGSRIVKGYRISPPPIQFEPVTGRIEAIGEFVASRGGEHNCWYYSTQPWIKGQINDADSESPFCFYDLAQDNDGIPELEVRAWYWLPNDPPFNNGSFTQPIEWIRYSWDQENTQSWRYAVGLVGRHLLDGQINFSDLSVRTVPYNLFPSWVNQQSWDMAVFSEFTGKSYWTSEGIYAVSYLEDQRFGDYFSGISNETPSPETELDKDFRMEWAINFNNHPYLYFSPVDHRLHLLGAQGGAWKIDDNHIIKYNNLGGSDYINSWTYLLDGQVQKSLLVKDGYILFYNQQGLILQQSNIIPELFRILPPENHDDWLALGKQLESEETTDKPDDFEGMLTQFDGPEMKLSGAKLNDFRSLNGGFHFILELLPGFTVSGEDWLILNRKKYGKYLVTYSGSFQVQPLSPPSLQLNFAPDKRPDEPSLSNVTGDVQVTLQNEGLEDAHSVQVNTGVLQEGQEIKWSTPQTVTVLSGETVPVTFDFTPNKPGRYVILARAFYQDENRASPITVTSQRTIDVKQADQPGFIREISAFGLANPFAVILFLTSVAVTGTLSLIAILRSTNSQDVQETLESR